MPQGFGERMVRANVHIESGTAELRLAPNPCATRKEYLWLMGLSVLFAGAVAGYFLVKGLWLVVPFTGLELGLLLWGMHYTKKRSEREEWIFVRDGLLSVSQGPDYLPYFQSQRIWTQVVKETSSRNGELERIKFRSQGREVEIGSFLGSEEKNKLLSELAGITRMVDRS